MAKTKKKVEKRTMKVEVTPTDLVITFPLVKPFLPSKSGKSIVVATTRGNQPTEAQIDGRPLIVGLNAYYKEE